MENPERIWMPDRRRCHFGCRGAIVRPAAGCQYCDGVAVEYIRADLAAPLPREKDPTE
jgi:hypothetical protein